MTATDRVQKMNERRFPKYPLAGVGAVIFWGDRVLLIQRGQEPACGKWSVPGGLVEVGEKLHETVAREVREEVGLEIEVVALAAVLNRIIRDSLGRVEYHYLLLDFVCLARDHHPAPASDVTDCAFVPLDAIESYPLTEGTAQVIRLAHARLNRPALDPVYLPDL